MNLTLTLTAKRAKEPNGRQRTELYYSDGTLAGIIPAASRQPRRNTTQTRLNGWVFNLKWI